ncbi:hypothetical protein Ccrd_026176 [Cynara cardunculus var. scolymus]|uniref:Uncharacterized protein n=1 Tax=Cynara cardunculus var. scolymus TaxID=59895 RepID=A0A103S986_CYNCS|nr:hypothetical protein Ccrd_026176 [Cynara cardunculus var. scolymus]
MASSRAVSRLCSRLHSLSPKFTTKRSPSLSLDSSSFVKSTSNPQVSSSSRRFSRLPVELSALITMMPLHSAIASACLKSGLSLESESWGLVPQEISMHHVSTNYDCMKWIKAFQCLYDDTVPEADVRMSRNTSRTSSNFRNVM